MLSAEGTGRTIEQAIENALFELKAPREDVDIKICNEGGLFKKAKVIVTISEDARSKYEKKERKEKAEEEDVLKKEKKLQAKEEKAAIKAQEKQEKIQEKLDKKTAKQQEKAEEKIEEDDAKNEINLDPIEFLQGLFQAAGKTVEINTKEDENYITYCVEGQDLGDMIGHRGETYYAINRLLNAVTGKQEKRILLDVGGYRERRAEVLKKLALRTADRVARTGRYARLDPMNPSDRRIIHSALSEDERVVTLSKGEEPHRYVMVFPKDM